MMRVRLLRLCNPLAFLCVVSLACAPAVMAAEASVGEDTVAEAALEAMERGDAEAAAARVREGLRTLPSSVLLHNLAGTILLITGDQAGSTEAWRYGRQTYPSEPMSAYGLAMVRMAEGDLDSAEQLLGEACTGGDAGVCLLARQYVAFLRGGASLPGLPETVRLGRLGLEVALAERRGDVEAALSGARALLRDPAVGRYAEYPSLLMTFERQRPLAYGLPRLPRGSLAPARAPSAEAVTGVLPLSVKDWDVAYVAFRVDGRLLSVANTRPFRFNWDTRTVPNGPHLVEAVGCDVRGQEVYRQQRQIVTQNADAPVPERRRQILGRLWALLALRPSRAGVALIAARATARAGDAAEAQRWLWRACAIDPDAATEAWLPRPAGSAGASPLWRAHTLEKVVALTFDDGPRPGFTDRLLDVLQREGVPATFFVIGRHAAASPDLIAKLAAAGMEIANHSFTHPNLARLSEAEARRELLRTSACVADITGKAPTWFRPPGGNAGERTVRLAGALGLRACMWTVNGEQKELEGPGALVSHVISRVQPGAVVLLHNGREATITALENLIRELKRRGYRFVTVSELATRQGTPSIPAVLQ